MEWPQPAQTKTITVLKADKDSPRQGKPEGGLLEEDEIIKRDELYNGNRQLLFKAPLPPLSNNGAKQQIQHQSSSDLLAAASLIFFTTTARTGIISVGCFFTNQCFWRI